MEVQVLAGGRTIISGKISRPLPKSPPYEMSLPGQTAEFRGQIVVVELLHIGGTRRDAGLDATDNHVVGYGRSRAAHRSSRNPTRGAATRANGGRSHSPPAGG